MIRLSCNLAKKVPIQGQDFSSQSFGATIDCEVGSAEASSIQSQLQQMYRLLEQSIDQQIRGANDSLSDNFLTNSPTGFLNAPSQVSKSKPEPTHHNNKRNTNNHRPATKAQIKAIYAISKAKNINQEYLVSNIIPQFSDSKSIEELSLAEASKIIKNLNGNNNNSLHDRR